MPVIVILVLILLVLILVIDVYKRQEHGPSAAAR